jgi:hypothetical protein
LPFVCPSWLSRLANTKFQSHRVPLAISRDRKYAYLAWNLSDDGKHLRLRSVQSKLMPKEQKDSARVAELLKEKAKSPELFGEEIQFSRVK